MNIPQIDRSVLKIGNIKDESDEKVYWLSKSPHERIHAIEIMRTIIYGEHATSQRLQRFFEIAERK